MRQNEFITSDTHFWHKNICKYTGRPFSSVEEMNAGIIERWNNKVPSNAIVYHLGDFAFCGAKKAIEILDQLNGKIILIRGNHDRGMKQSVKDKFEKVVYQIHTKTEDGIIITMNHFPFLVWEEMHHGSWCVHGHSHGNLPDFGVKRMDVGVDCHPNLEPFSFTEVKSYMDARTIKIVDHHNESTNP